MVRNKYPHFNPINHKIESKIATVKTGHHCKFNINYHMIWIPKYRKHLLKGNVKFALKKMIEQLCYDLRLELLALEVMPDHLHLFVGARTTHNPANIVKRLKGNTSVRLRRIFPEIKYLGFKQHYGTGFDNLWARGYYCGSAGHVSQEQVKRYIQEQDGKDIFEYSVFNAPKNSQMKIGDFSV